MSKQTPTQMDRYCRYAEPQKTKNKTKKLVHRCTQVCHDEEKKKRKKRRGGGGGGESCIDGQVLPVCRAEMKKMKKKPLVSRCTCTVKNKQKTTTLLHRCTGIPSHNATLTNLKIKTAVRPPPPPPPPPVLVNTVLKTINLPPSPLPPLHFVRGREVTPPDLCDGNGRKLAYKQFQVRWEDGEEYKDNSGVGGGGRGGRRFGTGASSGKDGN